MTEPAVQLLVAVIRRYSRVVGAERRALVRNVAAWRACTDERRQVVDLLSGDWPEMFAALDSAGPQADALAFDLIDAATDLSTLDAEHEPA